MVEVGSRRTAVCRGVQYQQVIVTIMCYIIASAWLWWMWQPTFDYINV